VKQTTCNKNGSTVKNKESRDLKDYIYIYMLHVAASFAVPKLEFQAILSPEEYNILQTILYLEEYDKLQAIICPEEYDMLQEILCPEDYGMLQAKLCPEEMICFRQSCVLRIYATDNPAS
jgi:hypothetical protein